VQHGDSFEAHGLFRDFTSEVLDPAVRFCFFWSWTPMRFTLLPFLLAMVIAIANMPTDIFQICAWNHGTEKTEPWRSKLSDTLAIKRVIALGSRVRDWLTELTNVPLFASQTGEVAVDLLTAGGASRRYKSLLQAKADTFEKMKAIRTKLDDATLSDEDKTKLKADFKGLEAKFDGITEDLTAEQRFQERDREMQAVDDAAQAATRRAESAARVEVGRNRSEDDPKKGFKSHREYLQKVMEAGRTGRVDARLEPLKVKAAAGSDEQSGNEGQFGAFLVPMGFSPTLLQLTPEDDPTASLVTPIPMSNPIVSIPARTDKDHTTSVTGGLIVTRKRETVAATAARMQMEQVALHANSIFGLSYATEEILVDSPISFIAILAAGFKDQFSSHLFNERLNGNGQGEPLGVMNSPCVVSVAKETGQITKTIVTENVDKMVAACWKYGRAIWLANHDTFPSLQGLTRSVGVGGSLVNYLTYDPNGNAMLLGRPIYFSEYPATLGTVGDLILGVWSEYLHGTYQPLESAESIHVRFETHERTFKFWLRDDGQPWWKASLKPKRGASNLSPFVTLATR
jgi:HK97 family phage major capsid protein